MKALLSSFLLYLLCVTSLTANGFAAAKFKVIYNFKGAPDGAGIYGQLVFDAKGTIYGATAGGGTGNCNGGCGTVFELVRGPANSWSEIQLYSLNPTSDGAGPWGGMVFDPAGNLYGTTAKGGPQFFGTVFQLKGDWTYRVLHRFNWTDGALPSSLVFDPEHKHIYGTTILGGAVGYGVVFEITP